MFMKYSSQLTRVRALGGATAAGCGVSLGVGAAVAVAARVRPRVAGSVRLPTPVRAPL
jgi:hypothetical protein